MNTIITISLYKLCWILWVCCVVGYIGCDRDNQPGYTGNPVYMFTTIIIFVLLVVWRFML